MLSSDKDHKLLSQLDFQKKQNLNVKMIAVLKSAGGAAGGSGTSALSAAANASGEVSVCCFCVLFCWLLSNNREVKLPYSTYTDTHKLKP